MLQFYEKISQTWGGIDVLLNNDWLVHKESLISYETQVCREILDVNVLALCICTCEVVGDMEDKGGYVVNFY
ncbi:MAG: SDR family NAD(P)-dependent oxidoreductase [cyanobacterium endosymbiont of Rhopalodia musculus]|uniref:SDR family NAD(P)-dependent oxidoreductase n=1 Tax=cyanobacterium endosymbiont of Epithemia clementina EcSB TaxID=3034674 RepID=UPI002480FFCF|nr:SDR family NAD(P)-dependent oxidoreductase [cyanobacterium endosymbiont of Epithemia clementina EcSB]WGT68499.1 SDR family NAD(P)-dependent oxidoreductase [cyanobacterium endosymbiont of Epithemia clementina EcSB]